jgi:hypothetical protein
MSPSSHSFSVLSVSIFFTKRDGGVARAQYTLSVAKARNPIGKIGAMLTEIICDLRAIIKLKSQAGDSLQALKVRATGLVEETGMNRMIEVSKILQKIGR